MKSTDLQDSGNIVAEPKYFETLNNYLAKYVEAYKNMGFNFWGISPLNEPIVGITGDSGFPNTAWFPAYFSRFIYETMAPYFLKNHPEINILISETGRTATPFYVACMADYRNAHGYNLTNTTFPNVNYYGMHFNGFDTPNFWTRIGELQGVDFHPVTTEAMYEISSKHSAKDYLGSWSAAEAYAVNLVFDLNGNSTIYADWNMMLNQNGGPSWVGKYATSATYSDPDDNDVFYKNPIFYVQGHFSKLIKNGWNKRGSKSDGHGTVLAKPGIMLSVMESPDMTKRVAVMVNRYSSDQEVNYWDRDLKSEVDLVVPAYSVTSVYYSLV
jgi:glucosylceramidase